MNIIIGNIISLIAAFFMVASCITKIRSKVFYLQFMQCALLSVSSYFLGSYAGIVASLVSAIRSLVVAKGYFNKHMMQLFLVVSVGLGLIVNNRGFIGLLPMIANVQFALCCYLFTSIKGTRYSIWINLILWITYSFMVLDFSTAICDCIVFIVNTITLIKMKKEEMHIKRKEHQKFKLIGAK